MFRIIGGIIGFSALIFTTIVVPKINRRIMNLILSVSSILILWEFAMVAFIIVLIILILAGLNS